MSTGLGDYIINMVKDDIVPIGALVYQAQQTLGEPELSDVVLSHVAKTLAHLESQRLIVVGTFADGDFRRLSPKDARMWTAELILLYRAEKHPWVSRWIASFKDIDKV